MSCFCFSRYAFLEFENVEDAKDALENCNNTDIEGRSIRLEYSQSERERGGGGRGNSGLSICSLKFYQLYIVCKCLRIKVLTAFSTLCRTYKNPVCQRFVRRHHRSDSERLF